VAIAYGYYFYPIYTLGLEQLLRVAETAVKWKCNLLNAPKSIEKYQGSIEYLVTQDIINC